jgi:predicted RNA binding protein YcfA (HicA-like mRNA interferase family)
VKAFEKRGFWVARQGKHIVMTNGERIITIPRANPVDAFTMGGIVKDAGLTLDEYKNMWRGRRYRIKQVAPVVATEENKRVAVTVCVFYY